MTAPQSCHPRVGRRYTWRTGGAELLLSVTAIHELWIDFKAVGVKDPPDGMSIARWYLETACDRIEPARGGAAKETA